MAAKKRTVKRGRTQRAPDSGRAVAAAKQGVARSSSTRKGSARRADGTPSTRKGAARSAGGTPSKRTPAARRSGTAGTRAGSTPIDRYLAELPANQRRVLERLRRLIRAAAPGAEECISYGLAAFRLAGRPLVAFGAARGHCAFFPMSGNTVRDHARELAGYDTSKGTIRFQPGKPLPAKLLRKLVKARIAENAVQR